jgi:hypothetical protein
LVAASLAKKPSRGAATLEIPISRGEPKAGKDEDVLNEIPTIANRANPASTAGAGGERASSTAAPSERAGTYRIREHVEGRWAQLCYNRAIPMVED